MHRNPRARRWRRAVTTLSLVTAGLLAGAGIASAHVSVNPSEATAGDYTKLTFRVPNESPTAPTVLAGISLLVAAAALVVAAVALRRRPGGPTTPPREG